MSIITYWKIEMIGLYFVVKKNSWNIIVKSAKPPDYTLKKYSGEV